MVCTCTQKDDISGFASGAEENGITGCVFSSNYDQGMVPQDLMNFWSTEG